MRIKFYFFILVLFLFGLGIALVYLVGKMQAMHLYIAEAIIAFILIYLGVFYRKIVKPMSTIGSGMELLREQDFSSRLSRVGQYEADRIVNIFNRMMEQPCYVIFNITSQMLSIKLCNLYCSYSWYLIS